MSLDTLFIGLGGAGSNIVAKIKESLGEKDFISYMTVDTSEANVKEDIKFFHVKKNDSLGRSLSGTGGVRGEHLDDLRPGVKKFVDENMLHKHNGVVFLVFSAAGGSGSVLAPLALNELIPYGISVCCVVVHDTTNKQYANNSLKTLETLHSIANNQKHCLPVIHYNNQNSIVLVNENITKEISCVMEFHDTDNTTEIDDQDMRNFYDSKKYVALNIPAGVYSVANIKPNAAKDVIEKYDVLIGRSLTNDDSDPLKDGVAKYIDGNKNGVSNTGNENVVLLINNFDKQYTILVNAVESYLKEIKVHKILAKANDDGLVI